MGRRLNETQRQHLKKLCGDCLTYNLKPALAIAYIKQEMEGIVVDIRTINKYKKILREDEHTRKWYSDFARFRFVRKHAEMMDDLERIYQDTNTQIFIEEMKSPRNEGMIIRLKVLLMEIMLQISNYMADTPTMDAVRNKIDKANKIEEEQQLQDKKESQAPVNA